MKIIDNKGITDPTINLALEEYCVRNLNFEGQNYLLFYINEPSLIIGKHQNTIEEINSEYVKAKNIHVVRRVSGGGTVYHDQGNLNFSFMTKYDVSSLHNFRKFTQPVIDTLQEMGVNAELSGRNDIVVDGRKISGNAQFSNTKSMLSHGTLLFKSTLEDVVEALNVKLDKIESKGIKSVRSRVANITEFLAEVITIEEFKERLIKKIFENEPSSVHELTEAEWEKVYKLSEEKYKNWDWNYGRSPEFNLQKINRFEFGQVDVRLEVKDGVIKDIKIYGDFLAHGEMKEVEDMLIGAKFEESELTKILDEVDMHHYFGPITSGDFVKFLLY
jgi:lipoate---protein ligase